MLEHVLLGLVDGLGDAGSAVLAEPARHIGRIARQKGRAEIHIFYAKKMGKKYRARYLRHFKNPVIHEQNLRHEELLGLYPDDWCALVEKICLPEGSPA